ncbi:hypothetical protein L209DRAFT_797010 [Thermothelomyces heterothallicus CBS 203.75]
MSLVQGRRGCWTAPPVLNRTTWMLNIPIPIPIPIPIRRNPVRRTRRTCPCPGPRPEQFLQKEAKKAFDSTFFVLPGSSVGLRWTAVILNEVDRQQGVSSPVHTRVQQNLCGDAPGFPGRLFCKAVSEPKKPPPSVVAMLTTRCRTERCAADREATCLLIGSVASLALIISEICPEWTELVAM